MSTCRWCCEELSEGGWAIYDMECSLRKMAAGQNWPKKNTKETRGVGQ